MGANNPNNCFEQVPVPIALATVGYNSANHFLGGLITAANTRFVSLVDRQAPTDLENIVQGTLHRLAFRDFLQGFSQAENQEASLQFPISTIRGVERHLVSVLAQSPTEQKLGIRSRGLTIALTGLENTILETERDIARSHRDALTGLYTRDYVQHRIDSLKENGIPFAVLMMDMDRFRTVNHQEGHTGGDRALVAVAQALRDSIVSTDALTPDFVMQKELAEIIESATRTEEKRARNERRGNTGPLDSYGLTRIRGTVGRHGGDEFTVVLPNCAKDNIPIVISRINQRIALHNSRHPERIPLGISVGAFHSEDLQPGQDPLDMADQKLAEGKALSRLAFLKEQGLLLFGGNNATLRVFSQIEQKLWRVAVDRILPPQSAVNIMVALMAELANHPGYRANLAAEDQTRLSILCLTKFPEATGVNASDLFRLLSNKGQSLDERVMAALRRGMQEVVKN